MNIQEKEWNIPQISEELVHELFETIKPVIYNQEQGICYIEDVDPIRQAFAWDPTITSPADGLIEMDSVSTLHSSYPGLWKPSMEEIFAVIQDRPDLDMVAAVRVELFCAHPSGRGNIGMTTLCRKEQ